MWKTPAGEASLLRRLDYLPAWLAVGLGLGLGSLLGFLLAGGSPAPVGAGGFVVLLGLAGWLAWSGEPVAVLERAMETEQAPAAPPAPQPVDPHLELVSLPGGTFVMGSPDGESAHRVTLSPFACMRYPVTRRLYAEVMGTDPGWPEGEADDRPVNNVSWLDAVDFCNKLSEREGKVYRLPTEAEWEYACRAGTQTRWSFGDDHAELGRYAWFDGNSEGKPHPVGTKEPNPWGLYDMHGNVWEWCSDWFGPYSAEGQIDPTGAETGTGRVLRGGSFIDSPGILRSADRVRFLPVVRGRDIGFRCVLAPRRQP